MAEERGQPEPDPVRENRGLVVVVIVLGVLFILGLVGLIYGIVAGFGKDGEDRAMPGLDGDAPPARSAPAPDGAISGAPDGAIHGMTAADGILYLRIVLPDGREVVRAYGPEGTPLYEIDPVAPMP